MSISKAGIGNLLFHYRNGIGPVVYLAALVLGTPLYPWGRSDLNALLDVAGVLVAAAGQALRILTIGYDYIERGGKNRRVHASRLVQGGVFSHCRNPMYAGNILIGTGLALIVNAYLFYVLLLLFVLAYTCIVAAEEDFLRRAFGDEYADYQRRVNRWWPQWTGWHTSVQDMRFSWGRVLTKEYNTLFLLALAAVACKLWGDYRVMGASALLPAAASGGALMVWLTLYLGVRTLKKKRYVKD